MAFSSFRKPVTSVSIGIPQRDESGHQPGIGIFLLDPVPNNNRKL
jgi:hypothetical protein